MVNLRCCVCNARARPKLGVSMFCFPRKPELMKLWLRACQLDESDISKTTGVCSKHFSSDAFSSVTSKLSRLKNSAVPSVQLEQCLPRTEPSPGPGTSIAPADVSPAPGPSTSGTESPDVSTPGPSTSRTVTTDMSIPVTPVCRISSPKKPSTGKSSGRRTALYNVKLIQVDLQCHKHLKQIQSMTGKKTLGQTVAVMAASVYHVLARYERLRRRPERRPGERQRPQHYHPGHASREARLHILWWSFLTSDGCDLPWYSVVEPPDL